MKKALTVLTKHCMQAVLCGLNEKVPIYKPHIGRICWLSQKELISLVVISIYPSDSIMFKKVYFHEYVRGLTNGR